MNWLKQALLGVLLLGFIGCSSDSKECLIVYEEDTDYTDLSLTNLDDTSVYLSELMDTSKFTVLEFWRAKCPACVSAFDGVANLVKNYAEEVNVIGVAVGNFDESIAFIDEHAPVWTQVLDRSRVSLASYQVEFVPTFVLIDLDQKVIMKTCNISDIDKALQHEIEKLK